MRSYLDVKEQAIAETPLLLFDCDLSNGTTERWCTHAVTVGGSQYSARVLQHNVFDLQAATDQGVDGIPKITFELANADSHFSEIERQVGFKGAKLTARFLFFDLRNGVEASDAATLFKGVVNAPDLITEARFRLSALNRLSLQRLVLPPVRIQRRCPWSFPSTATQRAEAVNGGAEGNYSRFYKCGYSPDIAGGVGNLNGTQPFTNCNYTRADCTARGMFNIDQASRVTRRFGGEEFVPSSISVRSAGESGYHTSPISDNESRYNDFVPLIYGTAFLEPSIVFARNDGNLTRMEVVTGMGPIQGVLKVIVNGIEIPQGISGQNMTGTGWFNVISSGDRQGSFNPDFTDKAGTPLGDPYGSISFLSVVVPNRINDGRSIPSVQVLVQGLKIPAFDATGNPLGTQFSNNPAWVILDLLRRSGWTLGEFDLASFARSAAFCDTPISAKNLNGTVVQTPRFQCNLILKTRRSAGDVIRGIRNASRLFLTFGTNGLLQLKAEGKIVDQQPSVAPGSNASSPVNGGYAVYEFGDGSNGFGGILRNPDGSSSVRLSSRGVSDSPNRYTVEFQDAFNDYQQDSYSVVNTDDVATMGQEVTQTLNALGLPQYDQAARVLDLFLSKSLFGNTQIEFDTTVKGVGISPGDIITVTYAKEGLTRQPFRVLKVSVNTNYRTSKITAQWHDDAWYSDTAGQTGSDAATRRHSQFALTAPKPLGGTVLLSNGSWAFGVTESFNQTADGTAQLIATVDFSVPRTVSPDSPAIPLVSLIPAVNPSGGTLSGPALYYGVTSVGTNATESALSFVVSATQLSGSTNAVTLQNLSFPVGTTTFNVYRGTNPSQMLQIASGVPIAAQYVDTGMPTGSALPPDPNFDHAAFYWRAELQPEASATIYSASSIGNSILKMPADRYQGKVVRITAGTGAGQERLIVGNTDTTLSCRPWSILPDASSSFTVAEATFQRGATAKYSPIRFAIPNEAGSVVQISGRSVNANDVECAYDLCPLTRWTIGGSGPKIIDLDVPASPIFALDAPRNPGGTLLLSALSFPDLANTHTATAATLTLYYVDETVVTPNYTMAAQVGTTETVISLVPSLTGQPPSFLQVGAELMTVVQVLTGGNMVQVERGQLGTTAQPQAVGVSIVPLTSKAVVIPFVMGFFGSPASGNWSYPVSLPNVRVACASLSITNSQGSSDPTFNPYTRDRFGGIRTLSGGQYCFQLSGYLAVETGAAPEIVVDAPRVVFDVYATVGTAPLGAPVSADLTLNGLVLCSITIPDGRTTPTAALDGSVLGTLREKDRLGVNITSVGTTVPGSDLTVILRV